MQSALTAYFGGASTVSGIGSVGGSGSELGGKKKIKVDVGAASSVQTVSSHSFGKQQSMQPTHSAAFDKQTEQTTLTAARSMRVPGQAQGAADRDWMTGFGAGRAPMERPTTASQNN